MKTTNIVAFFLLVIAVLGDILPVASKSKIRCEPGTGYEKDAVEHVCEPCPNGTFSKGDNSLCRPCRTCDQNRLKKACSSTHNTVCKRKKVMCGGSWQTNKIHHLMKYCFQGIFSYKRKKSKCRGGNCNSRDTTKTTPATQISSLRYPSLMRPRVHRKKTRQKIMKHTVNKEDNLQSEILKNASLGTSRRPRSTHNITTSTPPWNIVVNTSTNTDFQESEGHQPHVISLLVTFGVFLLVMMATIVLLVRRQRRKSRRQESTFLTVSSKTVHERILNSSVMFDKMKHISRTETVVRPALSSNDYKHTHISKKSTNGGNHQWYSVPLSKRPVEQNEYFYFPCVAAERQIESKSLLPNETCRRTQAFSVSSGCSYLSRHGQRIDSDRDSFNFSDDSQNDKSEISYMPDASPAGSPNNTSPDPKKCAGMGDGRDENGSKMKPLISLDTVPPTCREATLKPRESYYTDVQRHVQQCFDAKRPGSQGRSYFLQTDNAQGRYSSITTKDAANVENSDDLFKKYWSGVMTDGTGDENQESHLCKVENSILYVPQQIDMKQDAEWKPETRELTGTISKTKDQGITNSSVRERFFETRSGQIAEFKDYINSEFLNNLTCSPLYVNTTESYKGINKNTETKNDTHLELENDILGEIPDRDPQRMSASTSGSTSPYPSSDEMTSSSQGSTSSEPGPVTYIQIHNIYPVKDTNMTANILCTSDMPEEREDTRYSSNQSDQRNEDGASVTRSTSISRDPSNTAVEKLNETAYMKNQRCNPENLHETLYKTEGTQTRHNCENMLTIFGQKWDVTKYFSSDGGKLTKSTTNMSLTVFANCIPEGETVLVSGRFTGNSLDVLPYLDEGWVVISPLTEFQMTYRKRWDKLVKIYLPYYPHHPKELLRVCYYHRTEKGDIEYGDVPSFDESKNQDMFYVKKPNHVEIFTVTFTLFHCACDHKFPLYLTSLVFTSYNKDENEAVVRVHIGDKLLGDQLVTKELEEKERREHGTTLKQSKDVRLLQCGEFDGDSRLVFKIDFPKNRSRVQDNTLVYSTTSGDSDVIVWENLFPQECPQTQERRFCELVKCMCQCNPGGKQTTETTCTSLRHHCREEIEWTYASTLLPTPRHFPCTISITHELPPGQEADRHDACQEGITWYRLKTPHGDLQPLAKESPRDEMLAHRDLPSYMKTEDDYCGLPYVQK